MNLFVLGVSGITGGGKTTLAKSVQQFLSDAHNANIFDTFHINQVQLIHQDKYFHVRDSPKHTWIPEINFINREILSAMDMDRFAIEVNTTVSQMRGESKKISKDLEICLESIDNGSEKRTNLNILIIEGYLIFNDERINRHCDLRLHIYLSYDCGYERRLNRTFKHINPQPKWYYDNFIWPMYHKYLNDIKHKFELEFIDGEQNVNEIFDQALQLITKNIRNKH